MTNVDLDQMRIRLRAARYQSSQWSREYAQDVSELISEVERLRVALGTRNTEAEQILLNEIARLQGQIDDTRAILRIECAQFGNNDWPDDLHLADVVEKHLARSAWREIRRLQEVDD